MSWDVKIYIDFAQRIDPVQRFVEIARMFAASPYFGEIVRIEISNYKRFDDKPILLSEVEALPHKYQGEDKVITGSWTVPLRYESNLPLPDPVSGISIIDVTIVGLEIRKRREKLWGTDCDMTYTAGDGKWFTPSYYEDVAQLNLPLLIQELSVVAQFRPVNMWGMGPDLRIPPAEPYLCYHQDPNAYLDDLRLLYPDAQLNGPITAIDIDRALYKSKTIAYHDGRFGPIVYHKELTDGNLKPFYELLLKRVSNFPRS